VGHPLEQATVAKPDPGEVLVQVAIGATRGTGLGTYVGHFQLILPYKAFTPGHEWTEMMIAAGKTLGAGLGFV
jgi:L-iditol 2-dehydrogenase